MRGCCWQPCGSPSSFFPKLVPNSHAFGLRIGSHSASGFICCFEAESALSCGPCDGEATTCATLSSSERANLGETLRSAYRKLRGVDWQCEHFTTMTRPCVEKPYTAYLYWAPWTNSQKIWIKNRLTRYGLRCRCAPNSAFAICFSGCACTRCKCALFRISSTSPCC